MIDDYALLLTDIVDSTRLSAQLGDSAMAAIWDAHDRAARDLLRRWQGREVERSDGFLLLFNNAADAAHFALAYHRALAGLPVPLKARAGLHVGRLRLRENLAADVALGAKSFQVEGLALPTISRVMAVAQGGQTLLTSAARATLDAVELDIKAHGYWRMKGLEDPIELFEIGDADSAFAPPPDSTKAYCVVRQHEVWLPRSQIQHSVPAERDAFIGRETTLHHLARRFDAGMRLISLLGIGGTGKTRLAQHFGWTRLGDFPGGVWFCDLSQARDLDGLVIAVTQGLQVPLTKGDPVVQIAAALSGRGECLVILDNFEQVQPLAEATAGQWLDRAPETRFIVTTRQVLGIVGEEVLALAPLPPADGAVLFRHRASAARADFHPTVEDEAAIAPLVRLLDGLPLAIELAAARVRVMPPRMLLARMSERFKLLESGGGRIDRQATLRAALDWSWDMLSAVEKASLARLSAFEGGFTLAAAEAVLEETGVNAGLAAMSLVQSMVEKSWIRRLTDDRFDLLLSVKEYAAEHLGADGRFPGSGASARDAANARHWRYFADLDERAATENRCVEIENLIAACRRASAYGDAPSASRTLANLWFALKLSGPFRAALEPAGAVRAIPAIAPSDLAVVDWVLGSALHLLGDMATSRQHFDAALASAREAPDRHIEARVLYAIGDQLAAQGRVAEALPMLERAHGMACELSDRRIQCVTLNGLGAVHNEAGRLAEAESNYRAALSLARDLKDPRWEGGMLGNLGGVNFAQGKFDAAREYYEQALILADVSGDRRWEGNTRCNLGLVYHELGRSAHARPEFEKALTLARNLGHTRLQSTVLCNLGIVVESLGDLAGARDFYEEAVKSAHELGDRRMEGLFLGYLGLLLARLSSHDAAGDCLGAGETLLEEVGDIPGLCHLLCHRAEALILVSDRTGATAVLDRTVQLAAKIDATAESEFGRALERVRSLLR